MADMVKLSGKILSGPNGEALKVEHIQQKTFHDRDGVEKDAIVFGGFATDVLLNPYNPDQGSTQLENGEVIPWEFAFPITTGDNKIKVSEVQGAFLFTDPLKDGVDDVLRFFDTDSRSIVPEMKAKGVYVKVYAKPKEGADPSKPVPVYFNLQARVERVNTSDPEARKRLMEKLMEKVESDNKIPF